MAARLALRVHGDPIPGATVLNCHHQSRRAGRCATRTTKAQFAAARKSFPQHVAVASATRFDGETELRRVIRHATAACAEANGVRSGCAGNNPARTPVSNFAGSILHQGELRPAHSACPPREGVVARAAASGAPAGERGAKGRESRHGAAPPGGCFQRIVSVGAGKCGPCGGRAGLWVDLLMPRGRKRCPGYFRVKSKMQHEVGNRSPPCRAGEDQIRRFFQKKGLRIQNRSNYASISSPSWAAFARVGCRADGAGQPPRCPVHPSRRK